MLAPGKVAHMIEFEVYIDEVFAFSQRSDGLDYPPLRPAPPPIRCRPAAQSSYAVAGRHHPGADVPAHTLSAHRW
ncbi:hypothetical protein LNP74_20440 [Klebsiella pneumoniae subsp. pneumoniae]|nr:hypothetical protein [Klebsiella pneumoniae subsp. pneumoniae]